METRPANEEEKNFLLSMINDIKEEKEAEKQSYFQIGGFPSQIEDGDIIAPSLLYNNCYLDFSMLSEEYFYLYQDGNCLNSENENLYFQVLNHEKLSRMLIEIGNFIDVNCKSVDKYNINNYLEILMFGYFYLKDTKYSIDKKRIHEFLDRHLLNQEKRNIFYFVGKEYKNIAKIGYNKIFDKILSWYIERQDTKEFIIDFCPVIENICEETGRKLEDVILLRAKNVLDDKAYEYFKENYKYLSRSDVCHILRVGKRIANNIDEFEKDYLRYKTLYELSKKMRSNTDQ